MTEHDATEQAYKNGHSNGFKEGYKEGFKKACQEMLDILERVNNKEDEL